MRIVVKTGAEDPIFGSGGRGVVSGGNRAVNGRNRRPARRLHRRITWTRPNAMGCIKNW